MEWYEGNLRYGGITYNLDNKLKGTSISAVYQDLLRLINLKDQFIVIAKSEEAESLYIEVVKKLEKAEVDFKKIRPVLISENIKAKNLTYLNSLSHLVSNNALLKDINLDNDLLFNVYSTKEKSMVENLFGLSQDNSQKGLLAMTKNPAYLFQEEGFRGRLERCLHADFIVLTHNPLYVPLRKIKVTKTYKKSKLVYSEN